jgi:hypothetical protein
LAEHIPSGFPFGGSLNAHTAIQGPFSGSPDAQPATWLLLEGIFDPQPGLQAFYHIFMPHGLIPLDSLPFGLRDSPLLYDRFTRKIFIEKQQ